MELREREAGERLDGIDGHEDHRIYLHEVEHRRRGIGKAVALVAEIYVLFAEALDESVTDLIYCTVTNYEDSALNSINFLGVVTFTHDHGPAALALMVIIENLKQGEGIVLTALLAAALLALDNLDVLGVAVVQIGGILGVIHGDITLNVNILKTLNTVGVASFNGKLQMGDIVEGETVDTGTNHISCDNVCACNKNSQGQNCGVCQSGYGVMTVNCALNALENIFVETNRVDEYLNYAKSLEPMQMHVVMQEDSLNFAAAELQFMTGKATEALPQYIALAARNGSRYQLPATAKAAQIYLDSQAYEQALPLYEQYLNLSPSSVEREEALFGMLTCAEELKDDGRIVKTASKIITEGASVALMEKAHYLRGLSYMHQQAYDKALLDLQPLAQNVVTNQGAQAQYLVAEAYFNLGDIDEAEQQIISFTQQKTQQQYWLAKALILLSDIYRLRGDDFQAQQYLLSLQNNYKQSDDILSIVADKLAQIE